MLGAITLMASCTYRYETVKNDPLNAKIYTLENGLKVYMTVNKDEPRIQTYIAVKMGGKNDPSDNTGLAHYLEHLMFKGTEHFGTMDYEAEKPLLEQIENLFEVYRTVSDPAERKKAYHQIDSLGQEASTYLIANEYAKMMTMIGASGTNAFTSEDCTCYEDEIPANQLDNWLKIAADRFRYSVFRGFHTELEAVYEEKNLAMSNDSRKARETMDSLLFPNHPYGMQTVLGTQEHLKNPSIKALRKQKDTYYVPNNMAICLSGDFNPDEAVAAIKKYFGNWEPNPNVPKYESVTVEPLNAPKSAEIYGPDSPFLLLSWSAPGINTGDSAIGDIVAQLLNNERSGLIDLDVIQAQKLLDIHVFHYERVDFSTFMISASNKEGQTLEEARDIILKEIAKLRNGEFSEELLEAVKANYKLRYMEQLEDNENRVDMLLFSFVANTSWDSDAHILDRLMKLTKEDVVEWARRYLGENNYAVVYKHSGEDKAIQKIEAPEITPIKLNRDVQSAFVTDISNSEVKPIEPKFVDYEKDMQKTDFAGLELLYKKNVKNEIGTLQFRYDYGLLSNPQLQLVEDAFRFLHTSSQSAEEIASKLYALACNVDFYADDEFSTITISGLDENIPKALAIAEDLLQNAIIDSEPINNLKDDILRTRTLNLDSKRFCDGMLYYYLFYGKDYVHQTVIPSREIAGITPEHIKNALEDILSKQHRILYYGSQSMTGVSAMLEKEHKTNDLQTVEKKYVAMCGNKDGEVVVIDYDAPEMEYWQYSNRGENFDIEWSPKVYLFNQYFGGPMNSIVFQEMRESRALAYTCRAWLVTPGFEKDTYAFYSNISTQTDKLQKASEGFSEIIENLPINPESFQIAKQSRLSYLRTYRVNGFDVLTDYLHSKDLGLSEPIEKYIFEHLDDLEMDDLEKTHEHWVKGRKYNYGVLGKMKDMDMDFLKTLGTVKVLSREEVFGY